MFDIQPWHWLTFGLVLIILEIFLPTFVFLMSGVAALIVAILAWFLPIDINLQIMLWAGLSIVFSVLWFKFLKPLQTDKTKAGLGGSAIIGEVGIIVNPPMGEQVGQIRFSVPLMGSDEWSCRSNSALKSGDRVQVVKILGNELLVEKTQHQ